MTTATAPTTAPAARTAPKLPRTRRQWQSLLRKVPGYDPFATAPTGSAFDAAAALRAIEFFHECLCHVKGELAGTPFFLEPWEQAIVANLFGWKRADGTRRYRECLVYVPRKNGKTALAAGLAVYVLACDGEPGAEIYSAASKRDQASLVFQQAAGMVAKEPELRSRLRIYGASGGAQQKSIVHESQGSFYKPISADAKTADGYNTHFAVIDELHAQRTPDLVEKLLTSTGARRQPLIVHITTADYERESICNRKHDYASKVRDGIVDDPSFLPVIYEALRKDDWTKRSVWRKANPNLEVSISEDYLARECRRAQESPAYENTFRRLHLNVRTEQVSRWLAMDRWDGCTETADPVRWRREALKLLKGSDCIGGLDLGSTSDLTALMLLFEGPAEDVLTLVPWFWMPRSGIRGKDPTHAALYEQWIREGFVTGTDGDVADYARIRADISALGDQFGVRELAVDRLFQGAQLCGDLQDDGFTVISFGQGFLSMAAPAREFEERVVSARFEHGGNPVLRWMASNATVKQDPAGNIKPVKPGRNSPLKIDGIVAALMALGRHMVGDAPGKSIYETRGIDFV